MAAVLRRVRVADLRRGEDGWVVAAALDLGYRHSAVTADQVVLEAELALAHGDAAQAEATIADIVRWRRENQPGGQNAGSVFTNPDGDSAGRLIDEAGCKGLRLGTAEVSSKHANFFIADNDGSADDVHALMRTVRDRVAAATGVVLVPETRLVGFDGEPQPEIEG
jgi:UDP-N-acetylmuramate dehydrogenase